MKERRSESAKAKNIKCFTPPIITTTAATPQDSPSTTLEPGASFSDWEKCQSIPSLLKPPVVIGSVKALNNLTPADQQRQSQIKLEIPSNRLTVATPLETELRAFLNVPKSDKEGIKSRSTSEISESKLQSSQTKRSSLKKSGNSKRTSVKKKRERNKSDSDMEIVLNNGRSDSTGNLDHSQQQNKNLKSAKRIQNNTKNTNKISPHNKHNITKCDTDSQKFYQYMNQQNITSGNFGGSIGGEGVGVGVGVGIGSVGCAIGGPSSTLNYRRRMSTMDPHAFQKITNLDIENLRNLRVRQLRQSLAAKGDTTPNNIQKSVCEATVVDPEPFKFTAEAIRKRVQIFTSEREDYALYIFPEDNRFRQICVWFVTQKWFDNVILLFIALNCITLAMERPNIPPNCAERYFLSTANYIFTVVFTIEMFVKVRQQIMHIHRNCSFDLLPKSELELSAPTARLCKFVILSKPSGFNRNNVNISSSKFTCGIYTLLIQMMHFYFNGQYAYELTVCYMYWATADLNCIFKELSMQVDVFHSSCE